MIFLKLAALLALVFGAPQPAVTAPNAGGGDASRLPSYVALTPNINDFGRFADGGPDENWYIGVNNAWIVQLPQAPIGEYARAFVGAKIGRAKTRSKQGRPWERELLPGKVYIAISRTPSFTAENSFFLAETSDIPLEPDAKAYMPGTGKSEWFWAEVPPGMVSFSGPNYLIIWSPTSALTDSASSPILAAFENKTRDEGEAHAWNNRSIGGVAPRRQEGTLETPIHNLLPALAIKLVPPNDASVTIHECSVRPAGDNLMFRFSAEGEGIESAWLETSQDQLDWERFTRPVRQPPFSYTLLRSRIPPRGAYLRAVARDMLGNDGACEGIFVPHEPK